MGAKDNWPSVGLFVLTHQFKHSMSLKEYHILLFCVCVCVTVHAAVFENHHLAFVVKKTKRKNNYLPLSCFMKAVISNYSTDLILTLTDGTDVSRLSCRGESERADRYLLTVTQMVLTCCTLQWNVYLLKGKRKIMSYVFIWMKSRVWNTVNFGEAEGPKQSPIIFIVII